MNFVSVFYLLFLTLFQGVETPYKPKDEFEVQVDYQFKQRSNPSTDSHVAIDFTETVAERDKKRYGTGIRPYLILNVKLIKLSELEVKARAENNLHQTMFNKKVKAGDFIKIDMGFTDDVKDRVGPYEVTIVFLSTQKTETSRIHMYVKEDGTFLVNGELQGKF